MVRRLIAGATELTFQGHLRWRADEDIQFDPYFSFASGAAQQGADEEEDEEDEEGEEEEEDEAERKPEDARVATEKVKGDDDQPSILEALSRKQLQRNARGGKRGRRGSATSTAAGSAGAFTFLPAGRVEVQIVRIWQAKMLADQWAAANGKRPVRLDKFVLRYCESGCAWPITLLLF